MIQDLLLGQIHAFGEFHEQGDTRGRFEGVAFAQPLVVAEHFSVVRHKNDERVVQLPRLLKRLQQAIIFLRQPDADAKCVVHSDVAND